MRGSYRIRNSILYRNTLIMESKIISLSATKDEITALKHIRRSALRCFNDNDYPEATKPELEIFVRLSDKIIDAFDNG